LALHWCSFNFTAFFVTLSASFRIVSAETPVP
jgi:hypothetical protein